MGGLLGFKTKAQRFFTTEHTECTELKMAATNLLERKEMGMLSAQTQTLVGITQEKKEIGIVSLELSPEKRAEWWNAKQELFQQSTLGY